MLTMTQASIADLSSSAGRVTDLVIKCSNLTKVFKDFWLRARVKAVDGIDMDVRNGEVFGLLGPNGSGKSTTIKMILGLLKPTSGRIAVMGKLPDDVAAKKMIGYLPEESYLYRFLNARETLDYYGRLFHQSRPQRMRRIDMLLEMVGLDAAQRRPVGEYSKGMQRRIGLAQALINDPALLILDEPTTGLDPIGTKQIKDLIIELARRGKTVLLCSHLLADVEDVCDRVAIMFGGKVRAYGTVDELLVKQNTTTLYTPDLDAGTVEQIDALLRSKGKAIERVERPRQRLEQLFLDIVARAQAEGLTTTGARSTSKIADFLTVEGNETASDSAAVLDRLMTTGKKSDEPAPLGVVPHAEPVKPTEPEPARQVISQLTQPKPAPAPPASRPAVPHHEPVQADLSVIEGLVKPSAPAAPARPAAPAAHPAAPAPPPVAAAPATPPPPPPASKSGEQPYEGFIKAIENVPEYKDEDGKGKGA
jgi:ABC-2 type transport system ATP-binding protein